MACVMAPLPHGAAAQSPADTQGVRHRIDALVSVEPDSALIQSTVAPKGTLDLFVRISANSQEARFFGTITPSFGGVLLSSGSVVAQTPIWEENTCHHRRGLPKATVTQVKGKFETETGKFEIGSVMRRIGVHVPADELTPGIKLPNGHDDIGSYYATRSQTRDTRINVDLKTYVFDCAL